MPSRKRSVPPDLSSAVSRNLIEARRRLGISRNDLASRTGISASVIRGIENGIAEKGNRRIRIVSIDESVALCNALGMTLEELTHAG